LTLTRFNFVQFRLTAENHIQRQCVFRESLSLLDTQRKDSCGSVAKINQNQKKTHKTAVADFDVLKNDILLHFKKQHAFSVYQRNYCQIQIARGLPFASLGPKVTF
jgi:hypothetical protein